MSWKETIIEVIRFCLKTKNKFGILRTFKWYLAAVVAICGPYNWHIYGKFGNTANEISGGISSGEISNYTFYIIFAITIAYIIVLFFLNKKEIQQDCLFKEKFIPYYEILYKDLGIEYNCSWTYYFAVDGNTVISIEQYGKLCRLVDYCYKCQCSEDFRYMYNITRNLGDVLNDLTKVFNVHKRPFGDDGYYFGRFYKDLPYNPNYDSDVEDFKSEEFLIADLTFEVVRLANLLLEKIREYEPNFFSECGMITVHDAKDSHGIYNTPVIYQKSEISDKPYPGLVAFLTERSTRIHHLGSDDELIPTLQNDFVIPKPRITQL